MEPSDTSPKNPDASTGQGALYEAELRQAQKLQAIGTLAGGIAHDFNNILYAITGYTEIIAEDLGPRHPSSRHVQQVLRAAARGASLVQKILAFSRPEEPEKRNLDLRKLCEETASLLRDTLPSHISLKLHMPASALPVMADYSQLQQVLLNLATNAYHAIADKKGGTIEISLDEVDVGEEELAHLGPGRYALLRVQDDGMGMTQETLERAFEPFFTTKPPGKGSGLGLSTAHGIVEALGGTIRTRSVLGEGSVFEVLLPGLGSKAPRPRSSPSSGTIAYACAIHRRIMVVDDEPAISEMLSLWLARHGHTVIEHTNPQKALEEIAGSPNLVDLLITDQTMPQMSGLDLARAVLELRPDLPVILATGYSESVDEEKARAVGVRAFVMKPFRMRHLENVLEKIWP
jgi:CheY-like chemotaxis protein